MKKKGRGLSYDDKREKMIKIFHSSVSFYLLSKLFLTTNKLKSCQSRLESLFLVSSKY